MRAILGGMQGSLKSLASGLRCYIAFVGTRFYIVSARKSIFLIECVCSSHVPEHRAFLPASSRDFVSVVHLISLRGHVQQLFELREDGLHPLAAMYGGRAHDIAPCMAVKIVVRFKVFQAPRSRRRRPALPRKAVFERGNQSG